MKRTIQRSMTLVLSLLMLMAFLVAPNAKASAEVKPKYDSVIDTNLRTSINSDGQLNSIIKATGEKGSTTRIEIELYVEKRVLGLFWTRVDIGTTNNTWIDSVNSWQYINAFSTQLSSSGTYRVTVKFTVFCADASSDVVTKVNTVTY